MPAAKETTQPKQNGADLSRSMAGGHNPWLVACIVSIATFMEVLDTSIANVSLDHIRGELGASIDESTWVLTSYLVSNAIILPISGWLASVFGRKRFYMSCVALFTVSSLLCGLAPSLSWLVFFRVLQGLGGGGLAPSEQSMLADTFRPEQRGQAFAIYGIAVVFAPAIGPTLGGWITDNYSWHWIFLINVPVGAVSLLLTHLVLTEPKKEEQERKARVKKGIKVDYIGFALVAIGLGAMQIVLDRGERLDWYESNFILAFSIISGIALIILILWELWHPDPIVNIRLLGYRSFASSCVLMFALGFILFGTTQLLPQFTQSLFGYTATLAGLVITPGGFAVITMMPLVGFLVNRTQPKYLVGFGMLIEAAAMWNMSRLSLDASYAKLAMARIYQAAGLAFLFIPITTASYAGIPPNQTNTASALINLMRNLGGSFGISLGQTWILQGQQRHQNYMVAHLTPSNPQFQVGMQAINRALHGTFSATASAGGGHATAANGLLFNIVQQQASALSYVDVFHKMMWYALFAFPLVFLIKNKKPGSGAAAH